MKSGSVVEKGTQKSVTNGSPSSFRRMLSGFRFPWTIPAWCAAPSAPATLIITFSDCSTDSEKSVTGLPFTYSEAM